MPFEPLTLQCCLCGRPCDGIDEHGTTLHADTRGTAYPLPWLCLSCAASNPDEVCCNGLDNYPELTT